MKLIHNVLPDDTLEKVAQYYNCSVYEIIKINNLKNTDISKLNSLIVPNNPNDFVVIKNYDKEVVVQVTLENKTDIEKILNNKNIVASTCSAKDYDVGDKIIIGSFNAAFHIVKPLESLEYIAKKYGVTTDNIINKNNLKTNKLFVGQQIFI